MRAMKIGNRPDHSFDEPLGLLSDCRHDSVLTAAAACAASQP
jgi:hypothetical protein